MSKPSFSGSLSYINYSSRTEVRTVRNP